MRNQSGNTKLGQEKHHKRNHLPITCLCDHQYFMIDLSSHKKFECPERSIVCRFCHLLVRAGNKSKLAKDLYLGGDLTEHESECGSRTIACVKCHKPVQLKEVQVHAQLHKIEPTQASPSRSILDQSLCANLNCSNMITARNPLTLCTTCYAPFWTALHEEDPIPRLTQKLIAVYHQQLTEGCGRPHCRNMYCATSRPDPDRTPTDAAILALDLFKKAQLDKSPKDLGEASQLPEFYFCMINEKTQNRRKNAEMLVGMGFTLVQSIEALKACQDDPERAVSWLLSRSE